MSFSLALEQSRRRMLEVDLMGRGISSPRVLNAMARVPRERFVPKQLAERAYDDCALPLDCDQSISQPYMVALMTEALQLEGHERVLEIGTGSGYQAAILAELAASVVTVERHAHLSREAGVILQELGYRNILLVVGDGTLGWPAGAPYDRIIVTAAAETCPPALWQQLCPSGILVGPFGSPEHQKLCLWHKTLGESSPKVITSCRFVPLVSEPEGRAT